MTSSKQRRLSVLILLIQDNSGRFSLFERRDNKRSLNFNSSKFSRGGGVCVKYGSMERKKDLLRSFTSSDSTLSASGSGKLFKGRLERLSISICLRKLSGIKKTITHHF